MYYENNYKLKFSKEKIVCSSNGGMSIKWMKQNFTKSMEYIQQELNKLCPGSIPIFEFEIQIQKFRLLGPITFVDLDAWINLSEQQIMYLKLMDLIHD